MIGLKNAVSMRARVMWVRAFMNTYKRRVIAAGGYIEGEQCAIDKINGNNILKEASWRLIPEGIKEDVVYAQKPTDGLGDLTFTRASDATRANSAGVIERTPWNLFTQSVWTGGGLNVAPTGWSVGQSTGNFEPVTTINGNVNYRFYGTSARRYFVQSLSVVSGQSVNLSVYVESVSIEQEISNTIIQSGVSVTGTTYYINGVAVPSNTLISAGTTVSYSATFTATGSAAFRIGGGCNGAATYDFVISRPQLVEGTDAKPYFATTNRQDVPRLDYRNADGSLNSCPRLLLEPQRTNLYTFSEQLNQWVATNATVTANYAVSPDGNTNADRVEFTAGGLLRVSSTGSAGENTLSVYAKATNGTSAKFRFFANGSILFSSDQTATGEWQRFTFTYTFSAVTAGLARPTTNGGVDDVIFWGFQHEIGAYATTYIPTTTAAVTRLADAASKTGVSSLIGQTEGTVYFDFVYNFLDTSVSQLFSISDGTVSNRLFIGFIRNNLLTAQVRTGGSTQAEISSSALTVGNRYKAAVGYKQNDIVFYINGVQIGTNLSANIPAADRIAFDNGAGSSNFTGTVNQSALFPTRLTNAQLAEITTL